MDELRTRLRLSEIVGKRVKLTRAGHEYKGCCPFHREKSPSFYVNDDKQFFHCFGCGAHGDHIGFVMRHDNVEFMDAVEMLASEAGLQIPQPSPKDVEKARRSKHLKTIMEDACRFFEDQLYLPENANIMGYLTQRRGLSPETVASFRLGFAPDHGQSLRAHLKKKGWTDRDMVETALLRPAKNGGEPYAFFRARVMFPVLDRRGEVVAFGGRILPDDIIAQDTSGGYKPAKYMNSTDTPLFHKGNMLYNESHARQNCAAGHDLIVVEGYADVIALAQAGFKAAVAPLGTALTERQIETLWHLLPHDDVDVERFVMADGESRPESVPYLCFDGDAAGQRAAMRAVERLLPLLQPGKTVRFVFLPDGQDPDDLVRAKGPDAMRTLLKNSVSLLDMLWLMQTRGRALDTPESRAAVEQRLDHAVAAIADRTVQGYYKSLLKDRIWRELKGGKARQDGMRSSSGAYAGRGNAPSQGGFRQGSGRGAGSGFGQSGFGQNRGPAQPAVSLPSPRDSARQWRDRIVMAALLNHPRMFDDVAEALGMTRFTSPALDTLRQTVIEILGMGADDATPEKLQADLAARGHGAAMAEALNESVYLHAGFARPNGDFVTAHAAVMDILTRERRPISAF